MCVLYIQLYNNLFNPSLNHLFPAKKPWASQHQRSVQLDNDHAHVCKTKWRSIWQLMSDRLSFKSSGYLFDIDRVMSGKVRPSVQLLVLNVIFTFTSYTDRFKMGAALNVQFRWRNYEQAVFTTAVLTCIGKVICVSSLKLLYLPQLSLLYLGFTSKPHFFFFTWWVFI